MVQEHHWEPPYLDKSAFTVDLEPIAKWMSALVPQVFERNLAPGFGFADALKNTVEEAKLFVELIDFWKRNAARLIPVPEHSAGDYSDCANWLTALHTLDSASYRTILEAWKLKHRRRKNLWKALERLKIPLL